MTKKEIVTEILEDLGYKPLVDEDGDIYIRYQMKTIYFVTGQEDEQYAVAILPQFAEVNEETFTLAICNKMTRDVKLSKVYIDQSLKNVSASCEFFYTDVESLRNNIVHSLNVLGLVRSTFTKMKAEYTDD